VKGVIAPNNHFEARLPVAGWTQRYVQLGCGGLCGVLQIRVEHAEQCDPVNSHGLVLASTDMGHSGHGMGDGGFGNDPALRTDFAYRGVHLTALAVKALIKLYYGQPQRYAYFSGCSDGGREALMEAERFPDDFNGIAAGAPALNFQLQNTFYHAWMAVSNHRPDGSAILLAAKLPALHAAALAACDALDGLKDGEIDNPQACRFDPAAARCAPGQAPSDACLTPEEVAVARKFYQGPTDSSGRRFLAGGPQVGSELAWRGVYVPETPDGMVVSTDAALGTIKYLAFAQNPPASYTLKDFKFDQSTLDALKTEHPLYDAGDTDLSAFQANGGKLLMWHGWSDPHISPLNSIAFYTGVQAKLRRPVGVRCSEPADGLGGVRRSASADHRRPRRHAGAHGTAPSGRDGAAPGRRRSDRSAPWTAAGRYARPVGQPGPARLRLSVAGPVQGIGLDRRGGQLRRCHARRRAQPRRVAGPRVHRPRFPPQLTVSGRLRASAPNP
jgi:feruloyl esterase